MGVSLKVVRSPALVIGECRVAAVTPAAVVLLLDDEEPIRCGANPAQIRAADRLRDSRVSVAVVMAGGQYWLLWLVDAMRARRRRSRRKESRARDLGRG